MSIFRNKRKGLKRLRGAERAVVEGLERRVYFSINGVPTTVHADQGVLLDAGDLDGSGSVFVPSGADITLDRARSNPYRGRIANNCLRRGPSGSLTCEHDWRLGPSPRWKQQFHWYVGPWNERPDYRE